MKQIFRMVQKLKTEKLQNLFTKNLEKLAHIQKVLKTEQMELMT